MLEFLRRQLAAAMEARDALQSDLDGVLVAPKAEQRDLTPEEGDAFNEKRAAVIAKDTEIDAFVARIKDAEADEARSARVSEVRSGLGTVQTERPTGGAVVTGEAKTYRKGDMTGTSFIRDMFAVATGSAHADEARQRLVRNTREVEVEHRALSTTAGAGGEFAPPEWLISQFVPLARAARPTADRVQNQTLPTGISSVNIPKLLTGTATAQQSTQNTAVQNTDATTGSVTAAIVTIAGQQVISQQLLDQSPINIDDILLQDLALDYAAKVDLFVLNNNATNAKGILQQAGTTSQTYTRTLAPGDTAALYAQVAQAIGAVQTSRYLPPDTIIMHPRRWAAFVAASDTSGRPIMPPTTAYSAQPGTVDRSYNAQGPVGNIAGLDVITDPQIPTNLGGGTNQDVVVVMRAADSILYEGNLRSEAFRETKADQLSVLLRVYNYAAFTANRFASSIAVIGGTGLIPPVYGN
jgi:HK97 family phage major capsid protein